jgi:hypothetical protein
MKYEDRSKENNNILLLYKSVYYVAPYPYVSIIKIYFYIMSYLLSIKFILVLFACLS